MEQPLLRIQPKNEPARASQLSPALIITKMQESTQTVTPFAKNGNSNNHQSKPLKFRFHKDDTVSVRVNGHWIHGQQLDPRLLLSLPAATRQAAMKRVVAIEFKTGRPLISASPVLVSNRVERSDKK